MANGDTKTESYLRVAAEGTRADLPSDTCCNTKTQNLILGVANRIMDVEDEVEEMKSNPDVVDIVGTYADLQNYDTSILTDKDVIRVLQDETHDGDSTYYRYSTSTGEFTYVGESKQYTDFVGTDGTSAGESGLVPAPATTDTGKFLKSDGTWGTVEVGPTVVQTPGVSTDSVMSQKAATKMVYHVLEGSLPSSVSGAIQIDPVYAGAPSQVTDQDYGDVIMIGRGALPTGSGSCRSIQIGAESQSSINGTALGFKATETSGEGVALGAFSNTGALNVVSVGNSSATTYVDIDGQTVTVPAFTRRIMNVSTPTSANDAATKGYVDNLVGNIESALHAINNGGNA